MNTIIGKKIEQKQGFLTDGTRIPVTVISVPAMKVLAVKTLERDGYTAVQLGFGTKKKATKAVMGHVKKANMTSAPALIREVALEEKDAALAPGDTVQLPDVLKVGDIVKVVGTSKGKGFAGVVKRHNFRGGPKTHGQSDRHRAPGSIGQTTTPGRVYRGKRMAGRMGQETVSITNLIVVDVVTRGSEAKVVVKGLVPGSLNSMVRIDKTGELSEKKFVPLLKEAEPEVVEEMPVVPEVIVDKANEASAVSQPEVEAVASTETVEKETPTLEEEGK